MRSKLTGIAVAALLLAAPASAQVVTDASQLTGPTSVIDFSQFALGGGWQWLGGDTQIGTLIGEDVFVRAVSSRGTVTLGDGGYGLSTNGSWSLKSSAGLDTSTGYLEFVFNGGPVSGVGAFVNYAPGNGNAFIEAIGLNGESLATQALTFTTSGQNQGRFFGFQLATAEITSFRLHNAYVIADDLTFSSTSTEVVPEPITMVLLGSGLVGIGGAARRRRKPADGRPVLTPLR